MRPTQMPFLITWWHTSMGRAPAALGLARARPAERVCTILSLCRCRRWQRSAAEHTIPGHITP
eukprot:6698209-Alexandrium_andersonii.AAC.1